LSAETPYGPLTAQQAVKIRRVLFLVVDAGRGPSGEWTQSLEGPTALEIVRAAADTAIDSSARSSFTAFDQTMIEWRDALLRWRCSLSLADRQSYGMAVRSDCHDLKFFVGRKQLGRSAPLNLIPFQRVFDCRAKKLKRSLRLVKMRSGPMRCFMHF
jgi:NTE family protein